MTIAGHEYSANAEELDLNDLDFLSGLTGLKVLRLPITAQGMGSYDISALANLTELTSISIPHSVKDLTPPQNLTKLESLSLVDGYMDMARGSFASLEPLKNLVNLKRLYILVAGNIGKEPVDLLPFKRTGASATPSGAG